MQARVKYSNTPESDRRPTVPHIVTLDDGIEIEVEATDPLDAIQRARKATGCEHLSGMWINKKTGNFRCLGCGFQYFLKDLPERDRDIDSPKSKWP